MTNITEQTAAPNTTGLILHRAFGYDLLVSLLSLGGERTYRAKPLDLRDSSRASRSRMWLRNRNTRNCG